VSAVLPLFAETTIAIAPVQTEFVAASLTIDGRRVVGLQAATPGGVAFYFIDGDQAAKLATALQSCASGIIVESGRLVVDGSQLPPPPKGA
jgi:hypothetical protein